MTNIAVYIADTSPSGITRYASNMTSLLSTHGVNCKIVSDTDLTMAKRADTIILRKTGEFKSYNVIERVMKLRKEIENNNFQLIISNGWYHDMIALAASKLSKIRPIVIGVVHTRPELWGVNGGWRNLLKGKLIKSIYSAEKLTISVSNSMATALRNEGWVANPRTIYNPIVSARIKELSKVRVRKDLKDPLKLACMGWISPIKGYDTAIKALSRIREEIPATLTIIGDSNNSSYYNMIKSQIKELKLENCVSFTGPLADPFETLDKMDLFLLPSRSEALPTALVEAMAIGLPVVACNCKYGPAEILKNGDYGAIVPVDDSEAMAKEVILLAKDAQIYADKSKLGIIRSEEFEFEKCAELYKEIINKYLNDVK